MVRINKQSCYLDIRDINPIHRHSKMEARAMSFRNKPKHHRSPLWPDARARHLLMEPFCRYCGDVQHLEVHHIRPVHLFPLLELEPSNMITLCEDAADTCHFKHGHLCNWMNWNPDIVDECTIEHPIPKD